MKDILDDSIKNFTPSKLSFSFIQTDWILKFSWSPVEVFRSNKIFTVRLGTRRVRICCWFSSRKFSFIYNNGILKYFPSLQSAQNNGHAGTTGVLIMLAATMSDILEFLIFGMITILSGEKQLNIERWLIIRIIPFENRDRIDRPILLYHYR